MDVQRQRRVTSKTDSMPVPIDPQRDPDSSVEKLPLLQVVVPAPSEVASCRCPWRVQFLLFPRLVAKVDVHSLDKGVSFQSKGHADL